MEVVQITRLSSGVPTLMKVDSFNITSFFVLIAIAYSPASSFNYSNILPSKTLTSFQRGIKTKISQ